jgi:hypothetical protein
MPEVAPVEHVFRGMAWPPSSSLVLETSGIHAFDTGGAIVLQRALAEARRQGCEVTIEGLRSEYAQLMSLVSANWSAVAEGGGAPAHSIGPGGLHAAALHDKHHVLPYFSKNREGFMEAMKHAVVINGAFFNQQRMMRPYLRNAFSTNRTVREWSLTG